MPKQALRAELTAVRQQAELAEAKWVDERTVRDLEAADTLAEANRRAEGLAKELEIAQVQAQEQTQAHARERGAERVRGGALEAERVGVVVRVLSAETAQLETDLVVARDLRAAHHVVERVGLEAVRAAREKEARKTFVETSSAFDTPFLSRLMCGLRESKA